MGGSRLRTLLLILLVVQTSATVLLLRYSRSTSGGQLYISTTMVFFTEVGKYLLSLALLAVQTGPMGMLGEFTSQVVKKPRETMLLALPASLYVLQNNLLILALTNLDAGTYQVTYQLKILTTAGCSVLLLGRRLTQRQWISLLVLVAGVALVQTPAVAVQPNKQQQDSVAGLVAVLVACCSSGFAGVFYERLVKQSCQPSMVIRNLQLGLFSLLFSFSTMVAYNWTDILQLGIFHGYTFSVVAVICLQAFGGLVVAATIKYADNILKGFATSVSIIVSGLVSWLLLDDLSPGPTFLAGSGLVLAASLLYSLPKPQKPAPGLLLPI